MTPGKQIRNAVILFSVPQNTGDEALLEAMMQGLKTLAPDITFSISVKNMHSLPSGMAQYQIVHDLDEAIFRDVNPFTTFWLQRIRKLFSRLGILHLAIQYAWWTTSCTKETMDSIDKADLILLSGGSYLHDTYDARPKLAAIIRLATRTSTPIVMMGHSVGPFWRQSSINLFRKALTKISVISLREALSLKWIPDELRHRIKIVPDLAFLHFKNRGNIDIVKKQGEDIRIGLCLRSWEKDDTCIEELGLAILHHLWEQYGAHITFISTCQGITGYVDDQKMSEKIIGRLGEGIQITIDQIHHSPDSFMHACQDFDAIISMRLHSCILAMVSGTPAFCIGYEDKSTGIYEMIGYDKYHMHYLNAPNDILKSIDAFLLSIPTVKQELPHKMDDMRKKAAMNFEPLKPFIRNE